MFGLSETLARVILIGLVALCVIGFFTVRSCQESRREAAEARQQAKEVSAYADAAEGAVAAVSARSEAEAELKDVVAVAAKEISNAEGSDQAIPPAARDAALRAACRLPNYSSDPACRSLLQPDS